MPVFYGVSSPYLEHQSYCENDIRQCIEDLQCQPILFIGSGFSRRYFGAPSWDGLLERLARECPTIMHEYLYFKQKHGGSYLKIAEEFASLYQEWAWTPLGRRTFPDRLFQGDVSSQDYIKYTVAQMLSEVTPNGIVSIANRALRAELTEFLNIKPYSLITTNYDGFLETILPDYRPVIGEQILRVDTTSIGDLLKIHGCVSQPSSIVLTEADYLNYRGKRKYLSAKLLTSFIEHPVVFMGYSVSDPNIQDLLEDIDEILAPNGGLVENIYIVTWRNGAEAESHFPLEHTIAFNSGRQIRVKQIIASEFSWVFRALSHHAPLQVDVKLLRSVLSRVQKLIRSDIPSGRVEVNYSTIEALLDSDSGLEKVFGVARIDEAQQINLNFPFTLSQLGKKLGYPGWHGAHRLLERIKKETGVDIQSSDNIYHVHIKTAKSGVRKYSDSAFNLLATVRDGEPYRNSIHEDLQLSQQVEQLILQPAE